MLIPRRAIRSLSYCLFSLLLVGSWAIGQPQPTRKALLIGLDGLIYSYIDEQDDEYLQEPQLTHFPTFTLTRAFVGGLIGTPSHQVSSSGPGWTTVLTGVWTDQHGVVRNDEKVSQVPGIFARLYEHDKELEFGSFAAWSDINTGHLVKDMAFVKRRVDGASRPDGSSVDAFVTTKLLEEFSDPRSDLDFIFLHLDEIDGAGHDCGWCPHYSEVLQKTDQHLGNILAAIEQRETAFNEQWLVMLVSDHGHKQEGGHGGDSVIERTSFIGVNRPELMNRLFFEPGEPINLTDDPEGNALMGYPGITSVVPTLLQYFGRAPQAEDEFAGNSLLDP